MIKTPEHCTVLLLCLILYHQILELVAFVFSLILERFPVFDFPYLLLLIDATAAAFV